MDPFLSMLGKALADETTRIPLTERRQKAQDFVIDYNKPQEQFVPGDLIVWKPGMMNYKFPEYGEPVMVLEVMDPPIRVHSSGDQYSCEPLDLRCIVRFDVDDPEHPEEEDAQVFTFDSHRMQKWQDPTRRGEAK